MDFRKFAIAATLFTFLTVISAKINIGSAELVFTFVLLSGLVGGANVGLTSQLMYLLFGLFIPVFPGSQVGPSGPLGFGPSVFLEYHAGFLISFPFAAFLCGYFAHQKLNFIRISLTVLLAYTLILTFGIIGMRINTDFSWNDIFYTAGIHKLKYTTLLREYLQVVLTGGVYFVYLFVRKNKIA